MAEGTIRIVRDSTQGTDRPTGHLDISDETISIPNSNRRRDTPSQSTSNSTRKSQTQRTTLNVEDRRSESSEVDTSNRTTPAPNKTEKVSRRQFAARPIFMSATEAKQNADYLVSATEMVGCVVAGPAGEMTAFERGILTPPLARMLERTPVQVVGKFTPIIDGAAIIIGLGMYIMRVSAGKKPSTKPAQQVQEDTDAPVAANPVTTVSSTRAGDVDGIAPPVPTVITQYMNGNV